MSVYHAGTARSGDDVVTAGGRVLGVTGVADRSHSRARRLRGVDAIHWPGVQVRTDIAADAAASARTGNGPVVIPRYAPTEMAELFTDRARFATWLEVELLATEGWAEVGEVPAEVAAACRAPAPKVDDAFVEEVADRERVTDHDVAAFVDVVQSAIGPPEGSWIHYGLTSSDVVDTALCATLTEAADLSITVMSQLMGRPPGSEPASASTPR